ncbi:MAG: DNA polymerase III subunit delta, partial [Deltaproteobacteria bacterium RIFOXYA12_FULL_61_11]
MSFEQVERLEKAPLRPILLVQDEEWFFAPRCVKVLKQRYLPKGLADFNFVRLDADKLTAEELGDHVRTMPVFAERRVVVLDRAEKAKTALLEGLANLAQTPVDSTCLIVLVQGKLDGRLKTVKVLREHSTELVFEKLRPKDLLPFIHRQLQNLGKRINDEGARLLADLIGPDLPLLVSELAKVATFVGDRTTITAQDVEEITSQVRLSTVFELLNALDEHHAPRALVILQHLLEEDSPHLLILAMLIRHLREIMQARLLLRQGLAQEEVQRRIGLRPFLAQRFFASLRR